MESGFWFLINGYWLLDNGFWLCGNGFWFPASGFWFLASGVWFLESGFWETASSSLKRFQFPSRKSLPASFAGKGMHVDGMCATDGWWWLVVAGWPA